MKQELRASMRIPDKKVKLDIDKCRINGLIFLKLVIENAYTIFGVNEIPLDATGLVRVSGVNLDSRTPSSNGAGKSTIWKCLLSLFYGRKISKREKQSDAYNTTVWNHRIEVHFLKNGHHYIARYSKKHKDYEDGLHVFQDGKPWGVKNNQEMLRKELQALINRTYEEFTGTIIWRQNNDHALIDGTPAERAKWISDFFGLSVYDDLFEEFKEKHTYSKEKVTNLAEVDAKAKVLKASMDNVGDMTKTKHKIGVLKKKLAKSNETSVDCVKNIERLKEQEASIKQLAELKAELEDSSMTSESIQSKISSSKKHIKSLNDALELSKKSSSVISSYRKLKSRKDDLTKAFEDIYCQVFDPEKQWPTTDQIKTLIRNYEKSSAELTATYKASKASAEANAKAVEAFRELDELTFADCTTKYLKELRDGHIDCIKEAEKIISKNEMVLERRELLDGHISKCPTCGSRVDVDALKTAIASAKSAIESANKAVLFHTKERKVYDRALELKVIASMGSAKGADLDVKSVRTKIEAFSKKITVLESLLDVSERLDRLVSEMKALKPEYMQCKNAKTIDVLKTNEEIDILERGIEDLVILHDKMKRYEELAMRFGVVDSINDKMSSIQRKLRTYADTKVEEDERSNELRLRIDRLEQSVRTYDQYKKEYASLEDGLAKLAKWTRMERIYKSLKKAYDKQGLKTVRLRELVDAIKSRLPVWTGILFTEKNFSIDATGNEKKIGFEVTQTQNVVVAGKTKKVVKRFDASEASGSERTRISCALMLTMSDVASSEKQCNLLVLDELERGLDAASRQIMSEEVIPLLKHKKPSLFLITHSLEVEPTVFDSELVVSKKNQQSTTTFKRSTHSIKKNKKVKK